MLELPEVLDTIECNRCGYKVFIKINISVQYMIINLNIFFQLLRWKQKLGYKMLKN